jgi:hypothetical protein
VLHNGGEKMFGQKVISTSVKQKKSELRPWLSFDTVTDKEAFSFQPITGLFQGSAKIGINSYKLHCCGK